MQLSLWPAGLASNGEGTVAWSGGLVDWTSADIKNAGYYYAMVNDVNVQCYDPPNGANVSGSKSYVYNSASGTNNTVETTNDNTVLKSLLGTGTNMSADYPSASGTNSANGPAATSEVATIPGLTGAGPGTNGQRGNDGSGTSGSGSGSGSSAVSSASSSSQTGFHGFSQGGGSGTSTAAPPKGERVLRGSMLAVLVAIVGLLAL